MNELSTEDGAIGVLTRALHRVMLPEVFVELVRCFSSFFAEDSHRFLEGTLYNVWLVHRQLVDCGRHIMPPVQLEVGTSQPRQNTNKFGKQRCLAVGRS